jgi:hypothetical protein
VDHQKENNGRLTFLEHWGFIVPTLTIFGVFTVIEFFRHLTGAPWIWLFAASFSLMISGGCLIGYAKFPVYRSGRFFTFGIKSVPRHLTGFYRWGLRLFLLGAILGLCLLLSNP